MCFLNLRQRHLAAREAPLVLAFGVVVGCLTSVASAFDVSWTNPSGGIFSDGSNWSTGAAPGTNDRALLDLANAYTVVFTADAATAGLSVPQGQVELDLQGHSYVLGDSVDIRGTTTQLHVRGDFTQTGGSFAANRRSDASR